MGLELQVSVDIPRWLLDAADRLPSIAQEELLAATEWGTQRFVQAVAPITPANVGTLRGAHQSEIRGAEAGALVRGRVFNPLGYALPTETGGRPHVAPFSKIRLWVQRKIGGRGQSTARAAYLIWRAIAARGTRGQHFFRRATSTVDAPVRARFAQALRRIRDRLSREG